MRRLAFFVTLLVCLASSARLAAAMDVSGRYDSPNREFGKVSVYRLIGDTTFGWRTADLAGDIDLNGHALVVETGGGNQTVFRGAISGAGTIEWRGGGVPQVSPSVLGGSKRNTFTGIFTLANGVLDLDKPAGVDAIPGDLVIGAKGGAMVRLATSNQIDDAAHVTLAGPGISGLDLQGHDEKFATLTVSTHGIIDIGEGAAALVVGDSSACTWDLTKTVTIRGFKPGKDRVIFGRDARGLTKDQVARIGFDNPAGLPEGLYRARIESDGQLVPDAQVTAVNPPFELSPEARVRRAALYEVPGLATLTGKDSPLRDGQTICFFGDSLTWQNRYIGAMDKAIKEGAGTKDKRIKLVNRGINGGGVLSLRDGSLKSAYPGDSPQKPFAAALAADKADVAVIFIGINDVWWRKTAPEVFEQALRGMVASAQSSTTTVVLATMAVHGELPDGRNGDDPKIERFCELTRKVAQDTGATLVDLRKAYIACLQNRNVQLRVDGTLYFSPKGVLTHDGVHPSAEGVPLLANLLADGLCRALKAAPLTPAEPRSVK